MIAWRRLCRNRTGVFNGLDWIGRPRSCRYGGIRTVHTHTRFKVFLDGGNHRALYVTGRRGGGSFSQVKSIAVPEMLRRALPRSLSEAFFFNVSLHVLLDVHSRLRHPLFQYGGVVHSCIDILLTIPQRLS